MSGHIYDARCSTCETIKNGDPEHKVSRRKFEGDSLGDCLKKIKEADWIMMEGTTKLVCPTCYGAHR